MAEFPINRQGKPPEEGNQLPTPSRPRERSETSPPRPLRLFVSYASEDGALAMALHRMLRDHLSSDFAEVEIDTESLRAGLDLTDQIRQQLLCTDILIVVYTGQMKASHSFTGLEIGFFLARERSAKEPVQRRIIPFYRDQPPDTVAGAKGVPFGITKVMLKLSPAEYDAQLQTLSDGHPVVAVLKNLESDVNAMRRLVGFGADQDFTPERRLQSTRTFLKAVFNELRKGVDFDYNPQKKLVIAVPRDLSTEAMELPGDAELRPEGAGTMLGVFGLPDQPITWGEFLRTADRQFVSAWKDVIETVVTSSLERVDVDNSQIVLSRNNSTLYRVILSRSMRYCDDRREFHLYFVEVARRSDFGNETSTKLLKALGLCCRFRFMFFEFRSEFSPEVLTLHINPYEIRESTRKLLRELNLIQRDAMEAQLNSAIDWLDLVERKDLEEMQRLYAPIDVKIRRAADAVLSASDDAILPAHQAMIAAISELSGAFAERNAQLVKRLGLAVSTIPERFPMQPH
jgi:hypothetical protein